MSCAQLSHSLTRHVVRHRSAVLLACAALLAAPGAFALDSGDIIVVSSKGEVHITVSGTARNLRAGQVLELPATVRTGRDGNIEIRQGATSVSVGPETLLEFPALEKRGAPIDRIQQPRGNAFYNIGKREGRKLRVETPYLVAVIKGTQFNVAALDEATTISLFEGRLEVHASDDSDVVDLEAGEIASRRRGDASIGTIRMESGKAPTTPRAPGSGSNIGTPSPIIPRVAPSDEVGEPLLVDSMVNSASVDLGVGADLRSSGASDTGAGIGVDNSVEMPANPAVIAGPSGADVAVSVGVDADPPGAGIVIVDSGSGAVDIGAGTVDAGVTVGASAPPVEVSVGVDAAVDVGTGAVNAGVDVGGANPDLGVDLGLDDDNSGPGNADDDGNNGHGNDDDRSDSSNPGRGNKK